MHYHTQIIQLSTHSHEKGKTSPQNKHPVSNSIVEDKFEVCTTVSATTLELEHARF